jgi:AcrR family transcriptional regulator
MIKKETAVSNRLLSAARELLLTKNSHEIKISDIKSRAHVGEGSFYRYFSSPYEIIQVLRSIEEEKCMDALLQYFCRTSAGTFSQKIERMAVYLVQYIRSSLDFQRIVGEDISWYNCFDKMIEADSEEQEQFNKELYEYAAAIGMSEEQARMNVHFLFTTAVRYSNSALSRESSLTIDETRNYIIKTASRLFPEA